MVCYTELYFGLSYRLVRKAVEEHTKNTLNIDNPLLDVDLNKAELSYCSGRTEMNFDG